MTALVVTGDFEACLQRLRWLSGRSSWRPFRFNVIIRDYVTHSLKLIMVCLFIFCWAVNVHHHQRIHLKYIFYDPYHKWLSRMEVHNAFVSPTIHCSEQFTCEDMSVPGRLKQLVTPPKMTRCIICSRGIREVSDCRWLRISRLRHKGRPRDSLNATGGVKSCHWQSPTHSATLRQSLGGLRAIKHVKGDTEKPCVHATWRHNGSVHSIASHTETEMAFWRHFPHWRHRKLSKWQVPV